MLEYRLYNQNGVEWFGPLDSLLETYITFDGAEYRVEQDPRGWFINFRNGPQETLKPWAKAFSKSEAEALRLFRDHMLHCLKFEDKSWGLETRAHYEKRMLEEMLDV